MKPDWARWVERLTLPQLRASVRGRTYRRIWALTAVGYVVISLFVGQMIFIFLPSSPLDQQPVQFEWIGPGQVSNAYLIPGVIVLAPHLVLALAFWPTLVMSVLGVAIGLSVASTVATFVSERRRQAELAASGIAPAVTGWAFLGACCCSSCAAQVAATGLVGVAVGSTPTALISQAWPLAVLQLLVVGLSLLYLEYRRETPTAAWVPARSAPRLAAAVAVRVALLIAGVTWLFAMFVEMGDSPSLTPGLAYHWTTEHVLLALVAIVSALAPTRLAWLLPRARRPMWVARTLLLVAAVTWGVGVPPAGVAAGLGGFVNELMGYLALPVSWGAVAPDSPVGAALAFHWAFQHLLLAGWAAAVSLAPLPALDAISAGEARPEPAAVPPARVPVPAVIGAKGGD